MPEPEPGSPTPTERFDRLWEEIGAKRLTIGDQEKGVEITVDADLTLFGILDKLKEAARSGHAEGAISDAEEKAIARTIEDTARTLSGSLHDKLRAQIERLAEKHR